ncbi:hypothetical protein Hanom_Chr15g01362461 [Helianthus anomalus]
MRPTMSEVVNMLKGKTSVPETVPEASSNTEDLRFKAMRNFQSKMRGEGSQTGGQNQNSNKNQTDKNSSLKSDDDAFEIRSVDKRSY